MKHAFHRWFNGPKDLIAITIVVTWCIAIFLPEYLIDEVTQRSFERILLMVVGFYFGSHEHDKQYTDSKKQSKTAEKETEQCRK